jgi:hypothetical protein
MERKLEMYPQGGEKRKERGWIGGDEWRRERVFKNTYREMRMKIVKSVTSSESSG